MNFEDRLKFEELEENEEYTFWVSSNTGKGGEFTVKIENIHVTFGEMRKISGKVVDSGKEFRVYFPNVHVELLSANDGIESIGRVTSVFPTE